VVRASTILFAHQRAIKSFQISGTAISAISAQALEEGALNQQYCIDQTLEDP
jgi:hypothetical protein